MAIFVMATFGRQVGEWTANTDPQTRNSKEGLAVSELIQYLRLPPRAPKRNDFRKEVVSFWSEVCLAAREVCFASEVVLWTVKFLRKRAAHFASRCVQHNTSLRHCRASLAAKQHTSLSNDDRPVAFCGRAVWCYSAGRSSEGWSRRKRTKSSERSGSMRVQSSSSWRM